MWVLLTELKITLEMKTQKVWRISTTMPLNFLQSHQQVSLTASKERARLLRNYLSQESLPCRSQSCWSALRQRRDVSRLSSRTTRQRPPSTRSAQAYLLPPLSSKRINPLLEKWLSPAKWVSQSSTGSTSHSKAKMLKHFARGNPSCSSQARRGETQDSINWVNRMTTPI